MHIVHTKFNAFFLYIRSPIDRSPNATLGCSAFCDCDKNIFSPVCGSDGITYFSSCHAGCNDSFNDNGKTQFNNCACISPGK